VCALIRFAVAHGPEIAARLAPSAPPASAGPADDDGDDGDLTLAEHEVA
jgi:hypothetical protein